MGAATKSPAKKGKCRFPKKELKQWLKGRDGWNHDEWLALLADLRENGFAEHVDSWEGCNAVGAYLEANRK